MPPETDPEINPETDPETPEPEQSGKTEQDKEDPNSIAYWRRKAERRESELKRLTREKMTESERIKAEAEDNRLRAEKSESELQAYKTAQKFRTIAEKYDVIDFESVSLYAKDKVKLDSNGELIGADSFLKSLRQSKPHLFKTQNVGTGGRATTGNSSTFNLNSEIRRAAGRE